jgi:hypothetical protein
MAQIENGGSSTSVHAIVRRLRIHAGSLQKPNCETAREAARALEWIAYFAACVVRSVDNWEKVQPVNPRIKQDIELLREALRKEYHG